MPLGEYSRKRDFQKTAEPPARRAKGSARRFVIQKHAARRLHYDFRLEMNGALRSWAVPKGIPFARGEKRLAVQVEDHPVDYINFEGTIPRGQYGGGTVMVWDRGTYEPSSKTPVRDLAAGKLHFSLHGQKLRGEWYLVRLRGSDQWLLIRGGEDMPPVSARLDNFSALSGKTMQELSRSGDLWRSDRKTRQKPAPRHPAPRPKPEPSEPRRLRFVEPMKARLVNAPPAGDWLYEIKFDGYRALGLKEGAAAFLLSRNRKDFRGKFPEVAEALASLSAREAVVDGEIVALDPRGRSSFQLLQAREMGRERPPLFYYVFDLLYLDGRNLQRQPLSDRQDRLARLLPTEPGVIRYSAPLGSDALALLREARRLGLEGLVGKRPNSLYEPGSRSGAWVKLKLQNEQEFVIGGYTDPAGSRTHFGAILVGFFEGRQLRFAGKVGTGFDEALLRQLHARFQAIARADCPFVNLPEGRPGRFGAGVTASAMKRCHWVQPVLICQVKFSEWTRDDKLRQPVFLGLRSDKEPAQVVRERAR